LAETAAGEDHRAVAVVVDPLQHSLHPPRTASSRDRAVARPSQSLSSVSVPGDPQLAVGGRRTWSPVGSVLRSNASSQSAARRVVVIVRQRSRVGVQRRDRK
jgi:hypothetical protein